MNMLVMQRESVIFYSTESFKFKILVVALNTLESPLESVQSESRVDAIISHIPMKTPTLHQSNETNSSKPLISLSFHPNVLDPAPPQQPVHLALRLPVLCQPYQVSRL